MDKLIDLLKVLKTKAERTPNEENKLFDSGLQQAYSHCYFEVLKIIEEEQVESKKRVNWKVANLLIGFMLGAIFILLALTT